MSAFQISAERRARWCAGAHFVVAIVLLAVVAGRMIVAPESFYAGALLIGPLAYFGAVFAVLFCFPRQLPGWATCILPKTVHAEYRDLFGLPARR